MSQTFSQRGLVMDFTAPGGGFTAGVAIAVGALVVVPRQTAASGVVTPCDVAGVHTLAKTTGEAWTEGQILYWVNGTAKFSTTATANQRAGTAASAQAAGDLTGKVRLDGIALGGAAP